MADYRAAVWPEIAPALTQLRGTNWFTHSLTPHASAWPSAQIKSVLSVPIHDLRTLLAEYLRNSAPERAPGLVQALLGHGTRPAGEEYRALTAGEAAAEVWAEIRAEIVTAR